MLPARCPRPNVCPSKWHWTARGRKRCADRGRRLAAIKRGSALTIKPSARQVLTNQAPSPAALAAQQKARDLAVPLSWLNPYDASLAQIGNAQLLALSPTELQTVWLLACADIYSINTAARYGVPALSAACGPNMDYAGYSSKSEFLAEVAALLEVSRTRAALPARLTVYRGQRFEGRFNGKRRDYATIVRHFTCRAVPGSIWTDPGVAFASVDAAVAENYSAPQVAGQWPVMLELEIDSALVLPPEAHRDQAVLEHLLDCHYLFNIVGQIILAPRTRWEFRSAELKGPSQVLTVRLRQVGVSCADPR